MRIVGGEYRSRKLAEFKGEAIRPTADSVRESLFNILRNRVEGCNFLDAFCGTGAVGLEALSRGAASVTFNDFSRESLSVLKKNLEILKVSERVIVKNSEASALLAGYAKESEERKFDIIYLDPPYLAGAENAFPFVAGALRKSGVAVYENEKPFAGKAEGLIVTDERKYGRVYLTFFEKL